MANPGLDSAQLDEALDALAQHGTVTAAALALGIPRGTFQSRLNRARLRTPAPPEFELDELPSELPTAEQLLARRMAQFSKKAAAKHARKLVPVKVKIDGPYGLAIGGDPHLDDDGTDIETIQRDVALIAGTEGLFGCNVGDYSNNWVGKMARLYGQQSVSAAEAWVLVEWYVRAVPWLFLVAGNHDLWSGAGDPIKWMARSARVAYESNGMRVGLQSPNGRVIRVNARHDFTGRSQYNPVFGVAKAATFGQRDHVLVAGHIHQSGYQIVKDPSTGLLSHCLRVASYKKFDRYAEEKGFADHAISPCPVVIVQPDQPDDSPRLITVFQDTATGADFLTFLRRRK